MKWTVKIRRDPDPDFEINSNTKVCCNHFTPEDFSCGGTDPHAARRVLKKTAVPSLFSWSNTTVKRTTRASLKARTEVQVHEQVSQQYSDSTDNFEIDERAVEDIDCPNSVESLQAKVVALSLQITELQVKYENSLFQLTNIKHDDEEVKFYTLFYFYKTF